MHLWWLRTHGGHREIRISYQFVHDNVNVKKWYSKSYTNNKLIEPMWRTKTSVNSAIIGSDNESSHVRHKAIDWFNAGLLFVGQHILWKLNQNANTSKQENHFNNSVWHMVAIASSPQNVNIYNYIDYVSLVHCCQSLLLGTLDTTVQKRGHTNPDHSSNRRLLRVLTWQITSGSCQTSQNRPLV